MNFTKLLHVALATTFLAGAASQSSLANRFVAATGNVPATYRSSGNAPAAPAKIVDTEYLNYRDQVRQKFQQKDFDGIEREAHKVRLSKERLPGGYWKLRGLYAALEEPPDKASDGDWEDHLNALGEWSKKQPHSVTAKVALASAWSLYGWKVRGNGYADSVADTAWEVFRKRLDSSRKALSEAAALKERCPYWYVTAIWVGIGQSLDREDLDKIFAAGVELEPTFYYIYQAKASYLLPRWGGSEGEWEKFADESALKLGGHQGDIVFFAIYSQMQTMHGMTFMNTHQQAVPRLIAGFRSIEKLYGASVHRLNEIAWFAWSGNDEAVKVEFFQRINDDNYDEAVWKSKRNFEGLKQGVLQRAKSSQLQPSNPDAQGKPNSVVPKN